MRAACVRVRPGVRRRRHARGHVRCRGGATCVGTRLTQRGFRIARPRQAATFDWHESKEEKLLHLKELITDKIYQTFGTTTQAFLDIDTSDSSRLSVKEFMVAMRECVALLSYHPLCAAPVTPTRSHPRSCRFGINMSRQQAITLFAPFAKERRNHLTLSEFTRFCESNTKVRSCPLSHPRGWLPRSRAQGCTLRRRRWCRRR